MTFFLGGLDFVVDGYIPVPVAGGGPGRCYARDHGNPGCSAVRHGYGGGGLGCLGMMMVLETLNGARGAPDWPETGGWGCVRVR